jgi:hypothetical protein
MSEDIRDGGEADLWRLPAERSAARQSLPTWLCSTVCSKKTYANPNLPMKLAMSGVCEGVLALGAVVPALQ